MIEGLREAGLSTADITQQTRLSRMTVWRIEAGAARQPSFETVAKIDRVYQRITGHSGISNGRR